MLSYLKIGPGYEPTIFGFFLRIFLPSHVEFTSIWSPIELIFKAPVGKFWTLFTFVCSLSGIPLRLWSQAFQELSGQGASLSGWWPSWFILKFPKFKGVWRWRNGGLSGFTAMRSLVQSPADMFFFFSVIGHSKSSIKLSVRTELRLKEECSILNNVLKGKSGNWDFPVIKQAPKSHKSHLICMFFSNN